MVWILIGILGLIAGSFLNCLAYRLPRAEKILFARSRCPKCQKILSWLELIPVVSFVLQRTRCRSCRQKISWQYPFVEIATAVLFLLVYWHTLDLLILQSFNLFVTSILILIFLIDLNDGVILDIVIWPGALIIFISQLLFGLSWWRLGLGMAISGSFFGLQYLVSRGRWIGAGDIGLGFLMGAILGWPSIIVALVFAYIGGAAIGLVLILLKKKTLASAVPFGAFLAPATIITMMWGEKIVNWYGNYLKLLF